jgi:hypothetical protein
MESSRTAEYTEAMGDEKALIPAPPLVPAKQNDAVERLKAAYEKLQKRDLVIVEAMNRFSELPMHSEDATDAQLQLLLAGSEADVQAAGWKDKRQLRMAAYGRLPKRLWPASMQAAHERVGMRLRKQSNASAKTVFNLNMITIPAPRQDPERKIVVIEAKEEKRR